MLMSLQSLPIGKDMGRTLMLDVSSVWCCPHQLLSVADWQGVPTLDRLSLIAVRQHMEWWDENFMVNVSIHVED